MLPVSALLRRADTAAVIVSALAAKARCGFGFRRIAADLGRPGETVRGWLRCFAERAEAVRSMFTVWLRAVDPDPVMPDAAGGVFADAVTVIAAVVAAIRRRFLLPMVSLAQAAVAVLTEKGTELGQVLLDINRWALKWVDPQDRGPAPKTPATTRR